MAIHANLKIISAAPLSFAPKLDYIYSDAQNKLTLREA